MDNTFENKFLRGEISVDVFNTLEGNQLVDYIDQNNFERFMETLRECDLRGVNFNNIRNEWGDTLLTKPCIQNKHNFLRELLKRGINVNTVDKENSTALHAAVANGSVECVKALLEYLPDTSIADTYHNKPHIARDYVSNMYRSETECKILSLLDEYEESNDPLLIKDAVYE